MNHYLPPTYNNTCLQEQNLPRTDTPENRYRFFSIIGATPVFTFDLRSPAVDVELARQWVALFKRVRPLTMQDFYPLTEWSLSRHVWLAMQFHDPETQHGLVVGFRRPECPYPTARLQLRGLDSATRYTLADEFTGKTEEAVGSELSEAFALTLSHCPDVAVRTYRPQPCS
jgi:hypothetical protein